MDISVDFIFKIAGIGIIAATLSQLLKSAGQAELATYTTIGGLIVVLVIVVQEVYNLFETVKTLFNL